MEQLEKMFPKGFVILIPRNLGKTPIGLEMFYSNPTQSEAIEQVVDDVLFALDEDMYWNGGRKKKDEPQG